MITGASDVDVDVYSSALQSDLTHVAEDRVGLEMCLSTKHALQRRKNYLIIVGLITSMTHLEIGHLDVL